MYEPKSKPDFVAKRRKCEDFQLFEDLFKDVHKTLRSGEKINKVQRPRHEGERLLYLKWHLSLC